LGSGAYAYFDHRVLLGPIGQRDQSHYPTAEPVVRSYPIPVWMEKIHFFADHPLRRQRAALIRTRPRHIGCGRRLLRVFTTFASSTTPRIRTARETVQGIPRSAGIQRPERSRTLVTTSSSSSALLDTGVGPVRTIKAGRIREVDRVVQHIA